MENNNSNNNNKMVGNNNSNNNNKMVGKEMVGKKVRLSCIGQLDMTIQRL